MDFAERFKKAVSDHDVDSLRQLFAQDTELGARIDEPIFFFDSPAIVFAASQGNRQLIDALLEYGANINARSQWWAGGFGVFDNERHELVPYLVERGARLDAHALARHGMADELRALLTAKPELVHARGGDGQTPLHVAASIEIAELLLNAGAESDALDIDHESTAAQYLIRSHPEITSFLVSRGCRTDILMAAATGNLERVRQHLDTNPESIRTRVNDQYFPMQNPKAGGSIYIWTLGRNRSPHQVARMFNHPSVVELLLERTPEDAKLLDACLTGRSDVVKALLAQDAERVHALAQANPNSISDAAEDNNLEGVRLMLECGWPVEGDNRHTPLHWACWQGNTAMVQVILQFHPPLEARDSDYQGTPLGWALHASENGPHKKTRDYAGTIAAMLKAGAIQPA